MSKKSNYYFLKVEIPDKETQRLEELNAFTMIEQIIKDIDIKKPAFQELADYVSSFESSNDRQIVLNELRIQLNHKLECDFEEIHPFLPKLFCDSFIATKMLETKNIMDKRQIKKYYVSDDNDERTTVESLPLFIQTITNHFLDNLVFNNPHYSEKIPVSKCQGLEHDILLETYTFLSYSLKMSNIDIEDLNYYIGIPSNKLNNLKLYSTYLTIRRNPYNGRYYYETLVELFIFYFVHKEIRRADLSENNNLFNNIPLHKLPDFFKYIKKNQVLLYTISYFSKIKKIDEEILINLWKAVFKPSRNSKIDTSNILVIPEPLINIDDYIPGKNQLTFSLCSLLDS